MSTPGPALLGRRRESLYFCCFGEMSIVVKHPHMTVRATKVA